MIAYRRAHLGVFRSVGQQLHGLDDNQAPHNGVCGGNGMNDIARHALQSTAQHRYSFCDRLKWLSRLTSLSCFLKRSMISSRTAMTPADT